MSDQATTQPKPQEISCAQVRALLSEYVDCELTVQDRANVQNHLALCVKCGTESSRMTGLKELVQLWDGLKSTPNFHEKVMQQYISESRMMDSKPFTDAADQARQGTQRQEQIAEDKREARPNSLATLVAVALAVAATAVLIYFLFFSNR